MVDSSNRVNGEGMIRTAERAENERAAPPEEATRPDAGFCRFLSCT